MLNLADDDEAENNRQSNLLAECLKRIQDQSFQMMRSIELVDLNATLDRAVDILKELRTSALAPRTYYELFMKILDHLRNLEDFFMNLNAQGTPMVQIYEQVQATNHVLPRLYLLITAGSCFIRSKEAPANVVLSDLLEMSKGIQHPLRGLFLRSYLSYATKDKLPDSGNAYLEGESGSVQDSIDFIVENFVEANSLWVRMHTKNSTNKKKRERERKDLRILVGMNLVRLSELEGIDSYVYKRDVLPRILDQVVACKDVIAQSYLMDCLIQAFPDKFQVDSLPIFLNSLPQLKGKVKVRVILENLMKRLGKYEEEEKSAIEMDEAVFFQLKDSANQLITERPSMSLLDIVLLQCSLLEFCSRMYSHRLDFVEICLEGATQAVVIKSTGTPLAEEVTDAIKRLLLAPLNSLAIRAAFSDKFVMLLRNLPWSSRAEVGRQFLQFVLGTDTTLNDPETMEKLLTMLAALIMEEPGNDDKEKSDENGKIEMLESDQNLLVKLLRKIPLEETDDAFEVLVVARKHFGRGGEKRIKFTLVPLVYIALELCRKAKAIEIEALKPKSSPVFDAFEGNLSEKEGEVEEGKSEESAEKSKIIPSPTHSDEKDGVGSEIDAQKNEPDEISEKGGESSESEYDESGEESADDDVPVPNSISAVSPLRIGSRKIFQFVHETVTAMAPLYPLLSLKLFLQSAVAADRAGFVPIAYEFISQACIIYEDEITEAKQQISATVLFCGTLTGCRNFPDNDWEALCTKTAQYCAKLLKKSDQCRAVSLCSHLFWGGEGSGGHKRDTRRVIECLQRALKIADASVDGGTKVILFVEILNHFLYFFEDGEDEIGVKYISGLVALTKEHLKGTENSANKAEAEKFLNNTLYYIGAKRESSDATEAMRAKFSAVAI